MNADTMTFDMRMRSGEPWIRSVRRFTTIDGAVRAAAEWLEVNAKNGVLEVEVRIVDAKALPRITHHLREIALSGGCGQ